MHLLFVCTHNRCRSILAEALARQVLGRDVWVQSAGSAPAGEVHPLTLRYLAERAIDTRGLSSKSWDHVDGPVPDIVVTVCDRAAGETCPLWLGDAEKVHWGLADPSAVTGGESAVRAAFMETIDELEHRLHRLQPLLEQCASPAAFADAMRAIADEGKHDRPA
jgi:arsenate reductase